MFTSNDTAVIDSVLDARYTCRSFSDKVPSKEEIEAVIHAGAISPFASIAAKEVTPFRHFFVFTKGDERLETINRLYREQSAADLANLQIEKETDEFLKNNSESLEKLWGTASVRGANVFPDPPCYIVVAEWRGARRAERQSLAHLMQNMWIKATSMNMAFNVISVTESMVNNKEFCDIFGLPVGMYGFHACVLGWDKNPAQPNTHHCSSEITWM